MEEELRHYGIVGMKWGVRRFQNKDGTLTSAGKKRYDDDGDSAVKKVLKKTSDAADKAMEKSRHETRMKTDPLYAARNKSQPWSEKTSKEQTQDDDPSVRSATSRKQRSKMSDTELAKEITRLKKEVELKDLEKKNRDEGEQYAKEILKDIGKRVITTAATGAILYGGKVLIDGGFSAGDLADAIFRGGAKKK